MVIDSMEKKLTRRQQQFLVQFLDLYREMNQPIHYKFVAERLKIGKVSVYEMLRLLEFNGYVKAEFTVNTNRKGPGRPSVLFYPTRQAFELTQRLAIVPPELEIWRNEKDSILDVLRKHDAAKIHELAEKMMANFGEETFALLQVTRNVTILMIILSELPETQKKKILMYQLAHIGIPGQMGLCTFFGFSIGVAFFGLFDERLSINLLNNIGKYEYYLQDMHTDNHQRLCDFIREAAGSLIE
jgi:hypothetical protein